ncbi:MULTISPECIES: sensor domain-containing diguanylate cyclase [unclassified Halomonas]|uniref:sensor domain-containing diguanylate cyclase n=1 Tax=unclassified Halomonas TaxID=2609666 RepID=UPI002646AD5C|nr:MULTISPECIES: sensor domain-containing diguanylate cyclase [unclassified Halomonas]
MPWKWKPEAIAAYHLASVSGKALTLSDLEMAKVGLLYNKLWVPVVSGLVVASLMLVAIWEANDPGLMLRWLAILGIISLLRLWLAYRFHYANPNPRHKGWLYTFALCALVAGAVWGAAGVLFFTPNHPEQLAAVAFAMAGVTGGGTSTLSSNRWIAMGFVIQALVPLSVLFWIEGTLVSRTFGAMVVIYLGLMMTTSAQLNRIIHDNFTLRIGILTREAQLLESERRYRSIFDHSPFGVLHFDKAGTITECNDELVKILGIEADLLIDYPMLAASADPRVAEAVRDALRDGTGYFEGVLDLKENLPGTPLRAIFNSVKDIDNQAIGGVAIIEDSTERMRHEAIIHRQANYDALTDLPNRRLFMTRLTALCDDAASHERTGVLLFLDMDRFKLINDTFGHAAGDALLVQVAERLSSHLKDDDMAARLSGDEFVMLVLINQPLTEAAEARAHQRMTELKAALTGQYSLNDQWVEVTPSMGYTCFNAVECDHAEVLRQADLAMYQAKAAGRARLSRYQSEMERGAGEGGHPTA